MRGTREEAYRDLFETTAGLNHLIVIRHLVSIWTPVERWSLTDVMRFVSRSLKGPADAWLTLNALEHLWLRGEVRTTPERLTGTYVTVDWWRKA